MNRKFKILGLTFLSLALIFGISCSSDEQSTAKQGSMNINGVPAGKVSLSVVSTMPQATRAADSMAIEIKDKNGVQVGTLTLIDARIALKEIKLKLGEEELDGKAEDKDGSGSIEDDEKEDAESIKVKKEENEKVKLNGPFVVNLLNNSISPSLDQISLVAGTYKEIEFKLDKIQGDELLANGNPIVSSSDPLFNNSIYVKGSYASANGLISISFELSFDLDEEVKLSGLNNSSLGFTVAPDSVNPIIIAFRLNKWFDFSNKEINPDQVDFSQINLASLASGGNKIVLSKESQGIYAKLREVIKNSIKKSADYGKDSNGDGKLSVNEDDDPDSEDSNDD